ncbi:MAG: hypothetical protein WDW36_000563 [Sanguina aurantia]
MKGRGGPKPCRAVSDNSTNTPKTKRSFFADVSENDSITLPTAVKEESILRVQPQVTPPTAPPTSVNNTAPSKTSNTNSRPASAAAASPPISHSSSSSSSSSTSNKVIQSQVTTIASTNGSSQTSQQRSAPTQIPAPQSSTQSPDSSTGSEASSANPTNSSSSSSVSRQQGPASYESRVSGVLLGALCGNVLGAPWANDRPHAVARMQPEGVRDIWRYNLPSPDGSILEYGTYTGELCTLLATARSLVADQGLSREGVIDELAALVTDPSSSKRRYSRYSFLETESTKTSTASDRPAREPHGPGDYGAATRAAPIGLAYRAAVQESCYFSHTHPAAQDAACVMAAAVAWLCRSDPTSSACTPQALLEHLVGVAETGEVVSLLQLLLRNQFCMTHTPDWRPLLKGHEWHKVQATLSAITYHGYATAGPEAVAVALWAVVTHWREPEDALIAAATFGGSVPATSQMTGALVGALHGDSWLPERWMEVVENGAGGRDDVARLAAQLASLDCSLPVDNSPDSVGQQQQQGQEGASGNWNGAGAHADGSSGGADGSVSLGAAAQFVSSA